MRALASILLAGLLCGLVLVLEACATAGVQGGAGEGPELARRRAEVETHPDSAEAWRRLGEHYYLHHRSDEAVEAWRESLRLDPDQADVRWSLGTVYSGQGDEAAAQRAYETALTIDPDHPYALNNLGVIYHHQGRLEEAEQLLKRAAEAHRSSLWSLGGVYADQGRWQEAVDAYEGSLEAEGWGLHGIAMVRTDLGRALIRLGRDDEALEALKKAVEPFCVFEEVPGGGGVDPERCAEVSWLLARLQARRGDLREALSNLRQALWFRPELREQVASEAELVPVLGLPEAADLDL